MNKNIFSLPASYHFSDCLAQWILEKYGADPLILPEILVLLPSRRACLAMREAFLRATGGRPTLLPRMQPLGDVDADMLLAVAGILETAPHPAFAGKRLFLLAHLIRAFQSNVHGKAERMDMAVHQAHEIASLLDEVEREGASLANLATLVPDQFAAHWQLTTEFLNIVAEHWPNLAAEKQLISPEEWRNRALLSLAAIWKANPPKHPVIAAGSTGSIASTAALLGVIAELPKGTVVLPGLDLQASDAYVEHLTESHPQWGMHELLGRLGVKREEVRELRGESVLGAARTAMLSRALCPPEVMAEWRLEFNGAKEAVQGLAFAPAADQQEEAAAIALMLREVLETPGKTAALVSHDRALARRVSAEVLRFGVQIDDSAGQALAQSPAAAFLRLVLEVAESNASPVELLALLKHPLAHLGMERGDCLEAARELELLQLRGVCPSYGLEGLHAGVKRAGNASPVLRALMAALEERLAPLLALFARAGGQEFAELFEVHLACAEALASEALWLGAEAKTLAAFIDEMRDAAAEAGRMEVSSYPSVFDALLAGRVVRPDYGMHPRLKILSPLEARMQSFDRIIIGGLNEGSWPPQVSADPWFNRPMRGAIGLSVPEKQIGQAAHDFMMLASAPEVIITRAEKVDGSPVAPARWWVRLMALLEHYGVKQHVQDTSYMSWARLQDAADEVVPCVRPAPVPPVDARPTKIAVTQVETWLADPYAFYAASVLKLRKLDEIDQDPTAADFGTAVHEALEAFALQYPAQLPADAIDKLLRCGREAFAPYEQYYPVVRAWWWPRFEQVAYWMIAQEKGLRPAISRVFAEVEGKLVMQGVSFIGRADRIEETAQGALAIVDYKTGGAHSAKQTREGEAIQLMLLALLAQEGAWEKAEIAAKRVERLEYWIAGGGRKSGEIRAVSAGQIADYVAIAKERLGVLVAQYQKPEQSYVAAVNSNKPDFEHLSRVAEWR